MKNIIKFGIIGSGWRARFFLRIAKMLPERFNATGIVVRNPEKGATIESVWGVKSYYNIEDFLKKSDYSFIVVSVPSDVMAKIVIGLASQDIPALMETPPSGNVNGLVTLFKAIGPNAKVQVSEQYSFQPQNAAIINLIKSGKLGKVSQAQVSIAHGYHGISLIRKFLDIRFENAVIKGIPFKFPIVNGPGRNGIPRKEEIKTSEQTIAYLSFGSRVGVYDFTDDQYFSWIRSPRVLIRGERGEINNSCICYLQDFKTPIQTEFLRQEAGQNGNLEGFYLKGILAGNDWVYKNPFLPGRLSDDEIAVATCLEKMESYANGGPSFYSLAEASQDTYLGIVIDKATASGKTIRTKKQIWVPI